MKSFCGDQFDDITHLNNQAEPSGGWSSNYLTYDKAYYNTKGNHENDPSEFSETLSQLVTNII